MRKMRKEEQGFNVDEFYVRKIRKQGRSMKCQDDKDKGIIKLAIGIKIQDQKSNLKALKEEKAEARKDLMSRLGKNTMKFRKAVDKLNMMGRKLRQEQEGSYTNKLDNLKKKHQEARNERDIKRQYKPKWKDRFPDLDIYREEEDAQAFQDLLKQIDKEHQEQEVLSIGGAELSDQEKSLLRLPPGTSVNPKLTSFEFDCNTEAMNAKLRMELRKWGEHD